jgi:hypothetical protein
VKGHLHTAGSNIYPTERKHRDLTLPALSDKHLFVFLRCVRRVLVTANDVPSSQILVTLTMEALSSSETSVLKRATRRDIPEGASLHRPECQFC